MTATIICAIALLLSCALLYELCLTLYSRHVMKKAIKGELPDQQRMARMRALLKRLKEEDE